MWRIHMSRNIFVKEYSMIDTHAHLYLSNQPMPQLLQQAQSAGVTGIINVATNLQNARLIMAQATDPTLAKQYRMTGEGFWLAATAGVHPCEELVPDDWLTQLEACLADERVVAIGETGLDLARSKVPLGVQLLRLRGHFELARKWGLPVILHCREAAIPFREAVMGWDDVVKIFHCFSEDEAFIQAVDSKLTYYSFTANITYETSVNSRQAVRRLPLNRCMLETDMPYLVPSLHKGKPNQSAYIGEVAHEMARIKGVSFDEVVATTTMVANRVYVRR